MTQRPFDSIESAQEYVTLLTEQVTEVRSGILEDIEAAARSDAPRRAEALRLVDYKLKQLAEHLVCSRRLLRDLGHLRRLLAVPEHDETPPQIEPHELHLVG